MNLRDAFHEQVQAMLSSSAEMIALGSCKSMEEYKAMCHGRVVLARVLDVFDEVYDRYLHEEEV